jgi:hypothetical protein
MTDETPPNPAAGLAPEFQPPSASQKAVFQWLFPNYPDEKQIARFFEVLGRAISTWQLVETALYEVYERTICPKRPGACGASFHAVQTFNIKLALTDAAVQFAFAEDGETLNVWDSIVKRAQKKSQRRNQFAHFSTFIMFNEKGSNEKIRLEPQIYDWRHVKDRPKLRMSEIADITNGFFDLANELRSFARKLPEGR